MTVRTIRFLSLASVGGADQPALRSAASAATCAGERDGSDVEASCAAILVSISPTRVSALFHRAARDAFQQWDAIIMPSCAAMPWRAEEPFPLAIDGKPGGPRGHAIYTAWVNAVDAPAIAIPACETGGIPIGCQIGGGIAPER